MNNAHGDFEVKLVPQSAADALIGRMSIDKQFHGDLVGVSKGQMLVAGTEIKTSAGYVAIERISGTLHERSGSFVLQHSGIMTATSQQQNIAVVPDSGAGQLAGLTGKMTITIAAGKHSYDFEYMLPGES